MVAKATKKKASKVTVGKLKLSKETVKNLSKTEAKRIKGGNLGPVCVTRLSARGL
jgi:hypothetical protein